MNEYTPEKIAELVAEARALDATDMHETRDWAEDAEELADRMADALTAVSAERDAEHGRAELLEENRSSWIGDAMELVSKAEAKHDRLHKAITEALDHDPLHGRSEGWHCVGMSYCIHGILRAALDKEGNDDE